MTEFKQLVHRCTMGDLKAMMEMFWHFINGAPDAPYHLTEENWRGVAAEESGVLDEYFSAHLESTKPAFFWLYRGDIYGSALAKEIRSTPPFSAYADNIYNLRLDDIRGKNMGFMTVYEGVYGKTMKEIGLPEFYLDVRYDVQPTYHGFRKGIIEARRDAGGCDADEDGFGMTIEYAFYYFNEFYELLTDIWGASVTEASKRYDRTEAECRVAWLEKQHARDEFWKIHKDDPAMEQYHQLQAPDFFQ